MAGVKSKEVKKDAREPEEILRRLFPPMLATLTDDIPRNEQNWSYELKYDGFRATAAIVNGRVALWSRNSIDLATRFPEVAAAISKIRVDEAAIDGEIVALDASGAPRFQLLQQGNSDLRFFVFDLIWLNGVDLRNRPLEERRALLAKLTPARSKIVALAEQIDLAGEAALALARQRGYEGLIAKQKGSVYESRRSKTWLKIKAVNAQELAIVGYTPSTHSSKEIGALILAVMDGGEMRFAGKVGTGFSAKLRSELQRELAHDADPEARVKGAPRMKDATWVRPRLVAQVQFTEWTSDGKLRHPSFLGLRHDKAPEECVLEKPGKSEPPSKRRKEKPPVALEPKQAPKRGAARVRAIAPNVTIQLTSPDRVLYPRDGITKQDVADYYNAVAEPMIHALADRPLSLEHWNQGIDQSSWFHQNVERDAEPWMTTIKTPTRTSKRSVRHLVADNVETLRWLSQRSALTLHMWSSRGASLESPDWFVLDLDPAKGEGIAQAIETALVIRGLFEQLEIPSIPKTSGKRGLHIFVPLASGHSHEQATEFACQIGEAVAAKLPYATTERALGARRGRLYLDCLQNGYGKTLVAPYSLRAIDGAPVSAPLLWSEVTRRLDPSRYNIKTMPKRLDKVGDLFAAALEGTFRIPS